MLSVSTECAEPQAMDMLTLRCISAELEEMRGAEGQTKVMLGVRVHGTGRSEDRM